MADNESYNLAYVGLNQREQNLFREEYYSGTDTKIYFDDVEQKEISYINYTIQEQLLPIFGYSSRTFDTVAVGNRVVNGTFVMPIRNPERIATVDDVISGAKNSFEKNEEYNNLETNKLKENDWIDESTGSGKLDNSGSGGNESAKTDGAGHIYDGTAADEAWHEGQKYQEYLDSQKEKEKTKDDGHIDTSGISDGEYMNMLKDMGYNDVLSFQKNRDWLENNGTLDNKTKEWIILSSWPAAEMPEMTPLMSGPTYSSSMIDKIPAGSKIYVTEVVKNTDNEWWYIYTATGLTGYVHYPDLGMG